MKKPQSKANTIKLNDAAIRSDYSDRIEIKWKDLIEKQLTGDMDIQKEWENISQIVKETTNEVVWNKKARMVIN